MDLFEFRLVPIFLGDLVPFRTLVGLVIFIAAYETKEFLSCLCKIAFGGLFVVTVFLLVFILVVVIVGLSVLSWVRIPFVVIENICRIGACLRVLWKL